MGEMTPRKSTDCDLDIEDEHQAVIADGAAHKVADAGTHRLEHGIVSHVLTAAFRVADADEVGQGIDLQRAVEQAADGTGLPAAWEPNGRGKDRLAQGIAEVAESDHLGIGLAVTHLAPEGSGEEGEEAHHREGNALDIGGASIICRKAGVMGWTKFEVMVNPK